MSTGVIAADDAMTELAEVLSTLCRASGPAVAAQLGPTRPSVRSEEFVRVEPTRFASIAAIEWRPWSDHEFGIALPEPAPATVWSLADLEKLVGPLQEIPRIQGSGPQFQGFLDDPALPARAAVYAVLDGNVDIDLDGDAPAAAIDELRIRIESMVNYR